MYTVFVCDIGLQSDKGMEMMTPFPVPTHSRLQETIRAVILTKEKPSFPVPVKDTRKCIQLFIYSKAYIKSSNLVISCEFSTYTNIQRLGSVALF